MGDINASEDVFIGGTIRSGNIFADPRITLGAAGATGIVQAAENTGTNATGGSLQLYGGKSTGTGIGGDIQFFVSPAGSSGSSANTWLQALYIEGSNRNVRIETRLSIGTTSPDYELDVAGNISLDEYIYHNDDDDTYIRFEDDTINIYVGGRQMIKLQEAATDKITLNNGGMDVDLQIKGENEANLIRTDAANDRVGIGTATPTHELNVVGDINVSEDVFIGGTITSGDITADTRITLGAAGEIGIVRAAENTGEDATGGGLQLYGGKSTGEGRGGDIQFFVSPEGSSGSSANTWLRALHIEGNGNVGIGTGYPRQLLNVDGNANITGGLNLSSYISCETLETDANGNVICGTDADTGRVNIFDQDLNTSDSVIFNELNVTSILRVGTVFAVDNGASTVNISGTTEFNDGWQNGGVTISDGNVFVQTLFAVNITSLGVSDLEINGSLVPNNLFNNTFDVGNSSLNWRSGYFGTEVYILGKKVSPWLYNQTTTDTHEVTNASISLYTNNSFSQVGNNTYAGIQFSYNFTLATNTSMFTEFGNFWINQSNQSQSRIFWYNHTGVSLTILNTINTTKNIQNLINSTNVYSTFNATYDDFAYNQTNINGSLWNVATGGIQYNGGNVGIGTSSPSGQLNIVSTSGVGTNMVNISANANQLTSLLIENANTNSGAGAILDISSRGTNDVGVRLYDGGTFWISGFDPAQSDTFFISKNWQFGTNDYFAITTDGLVGIGTATPLATLDVQGATNITGVLQVIGDRIIMARSTTVGIHGGIGVSPRSGIAFGTSNDLRFFTGSNVIAGVWDSSGNLGIGTTSPDKELHLSSTSPVFLIQETGSNDPQILLNTSDKEWSIRIDNSDSNNFEIRSLGASTFTPFTIGETAPSNAFVINSTGNIGIGTTSPNYELEVVGDIGIDANLYHNNDDDTYMTFAVDRARIYAGNQIIVDGDEDAGYARFGDGVLDVHVGSTGTPGTDATLFIGGSGGSYDAKVGIGTASPTALLHVNGAAIIQGTLNTTDRLNVNAQLTNIGANRPASSSSTNLLFGDFSNGDYEQLLWDNTDVLGKNFRFTDDLSVEGSLQVTSGINLTAFTSCTALETSSTGALICGTDGGGGSSWVSSSGLIYNDTAGVKVGIGASPGTELDIYDSSSPELRIRTSTIDGRLSADTTNGLVLYSTTEHTLSLGSNGTKDTIVITSDRVGIGTDAPDRELTIDGSINVTEGVFFPDTLGSGNSYVVPSGNNLNIGGRTGVMLQYNGANRYYAHSNYFAPESNDTRELGTPVLLWETLFVNDINSSGAAITNTLDTGQGANELYDMDQNVLTTSDSIFNTLDTGQGANELYDMDQNVLTTSDPIFNNVKIQQGHDDGIKFWGGSSTYMISMGSDQADDDSVTGYSMHFQMGGTVGRGFTFGPADTTVTASINALTGTIHTDGNVTVGGQINFDEDAALSTHGIFVNTSDGGDDNALCLSGGGACDSDRGAFVKILGNDFDYGTSEGVLTLAAGNNLGGGSIQLFTLELLRMKIDKAGWVNFGTGSPGTDEIEDSGDVHISEDLEVSGVAFMSSSTVWQSGDIAERLQTKEGREKHELCGADIGCLINSTDEDLDYGDLVCIDPSEPTTIMKCTDVESTLVVGFISESYVLNVGPYEGYPISLAGIVPAHITNENGDVVPGDLLVAASKEGYAMKAGDNPKIGTVVGKAYDFCAEEECKILTFVMLG